MALIVIPRIRSDIVATMMLLSVGLAGIFYFDDPFQVFASPAVITVAAALIIPRGVVQF